MLSMSYSICPFGSSEKSASSEIVSLVEPVTISCSGWNDPEDEGVNKFIYYGTYYCHVFYHLVLINCLEISY